MEPTLIRSRLEWKTELITGHTLLVDRGWVAQLSLLSLCWSVQKELFL